MNEVGIVVSRYYEDLKWIENIESNVDVYVYNRQGDSPNMGVPDAVAWAKPKDHNDPLGGLDVSKCRENGINLEIINIPDDPGFEASTYAYHMHSKYNSLNNFTVFAQAHPEIYVKNALQRFNDPNSIMCVSYIKGSGESLAPAVAHVTDIPIPIEFEIFCDQFGTVTPDHDYGWAPYANDFSKVPWLEFCKDMPRATTDAFGRWRPASSWSFGAGNQFVVSKKLIHKHKPEYYKKLQEFTNTYMDPNGDNRPHWQQLNQGPNIMEGIWQFIF